MESLQNLVQKFWQENITQEELEELKLLLENNEYRFNEETIKTFPDAKMESEIFIEPEKAANILKELHSKMRIDNKKTAVVKKLGNKRIWLVAAAFVSIVSSFFFFNKTHDNKIVAQYSDPIMPRKNQKLWVNSGDTIMPIELQDGSIVQLYQNSSISYTEPFTDMKRDINLVGQAFFKVAKDKHRPFTVYANGFATTALGTAFVVNSNIDNDVSVKLFEGKVVIKETGSDSTGWKDQYLLPNQKFDYDGITKKYTVSQFNEKAIVRESAIKKNQISTGDQTGLLAFNNEPLEKVLRHLETSYQVKLSFKDADIKGLYFTGTFSKRDDIKNILSIICNINELEFVPKGKQLIEISKSK